MALNLSSGRPGVCALETAGGRCQRRQRPPFGGAAGGARGPPRRAETARWAETPGGGRDSGDASDSADEDWSVSRFFGVVAERESGATRCSSDQSFIARKEALGLPDVDWARYNQQVLFVDSSDTVRARMAAGLMEIVANWNGWGMVLVTDRCGVHAQPGAHLDPSMAAGLLARAGPMGISSRHFTRTLQVFEVDDLYRYDLIVALDAKTKAAILEMAAQETQTAFTSRYLAYFQSKIAQLSDFNAWCSDEHLARKGGNALLPRKLSLELVPALSRTRAALDIARPDLSSSDGAVEWEDMQLSILLGVAGFLQFLIDSCPNDLPHWSTLGQRE